MLETIKKGDVTITLKLNDDGTVNLYTKMEVDYPGIDEKLRTVYPDAKNGVGTVKMQFDFINSSRAFDEMYYRKKLGLRIKQLREEAGLTQQELAEKADLQRPNIARIEVGKYSTGQDILSKIADALGKQLDIV
jgi:DNA-binding XRE family transcriptional regulator